VRVWEAFADELLKHKGHPKAITQVAIDMSLAYVKGVRENFGQRRDCFRQFNEGGGESASPGKHEKMIAGRRRSPKRDGTGERIQRTGRIRNPCGWKIWSRSI